MFNLEDTICALSTAPGMGAIAVIRLSGPAAIETTGRIFRPAEKNFDIASVKSHTIHLGVIGSGTDILDEVLVSFFRTPHSYTGEDVVEISCHGSTYIQQKILEVLLSCGLRLARPGEFTLRAFMNRKFDLSQAEAVADLIASQSVTSHDLAIQQMRGGFSKKIGELRQSLVEFTALIELELDFSEEHLIFADRADLRALLDRLETELTQLISSFSLGNVIKHGIPVAIIGKTNAGKSTLLNAILNEEKAIVSEIPGTTRDAIEDTIIIGGYSFRFIDTAGLRASEDAIETIGIGRTWEKISEANIVLYVFDAAEQSFKDVNEAITELKNTMEGKLINLVLIGNKIDKINMLPIGFKEFVEHETIFVSGKRRENIHLIAEHLVEITGKTSTTDQTIVSNSRHYEALQQALGAVASVRGGLNSGISPDLFTVDIHKALYHLGEITGVITNDEVLGAIFSRFCVGK
ncbi:MAG: tRNA uridine-5-carboxymethylaminomethyl(34) synthesis GTPase MnmE [bacterium]